jgi:hypothetical protein
MAVHFGGPIPPEEFLADFLLAAHKGIDESLPGKMKTSFAELKSWSVRGKRESLKAAWVAKLRVRRFTCHVGCPD